MDNSRTILELLLALRRLRRQERWTRDQIQAHQASALSRLRGHAYRSSPFYREFHAEAAARPLDELPVLTKERLREHFNDLVTDPAIDRAAITAHIEALRGSDRYLGRYVVNASSGTSGAPVYFLYDRGEWATALASFSRFERHVGSLQGLRQRPRTAIVASAAPSHMSARVGATVRSSVLPILRLDVGEAVESIVAQLNAYQPQHVAIYASVAGILAMEQEAGRLRISPQRMVCTAEPLSAALRQRLQANWGNVVFDQYGASEGGAFAVECDSPHCSMGRADSQRRGLHLFEDLFIFEVVDRKNRPVAPGQFGDKILLTVLFNHTLPLIRYELKDSIRMATEPCPCGCALAMIDGIQGRSETVLHLPGRNGREQVAVHPMVFYRILDALPVQNWQVRQERGDLNLVLSGGRQGVNEQELIDSIQQALLRLHADLPAVRVTWKSNVMRGLTGKARRIVPEAETSRPVRKIVIR
jgi:phenylacetate-CoA ligase